MEFLRDSRVYIVEGGVTYRLHVQEIEFNQSFKQHGYKTKTLHDQDRSLDGNGDINQPNSNWYDGSSITTANTAKFSLSIHMVDESSTHQHKLFDLLLNTSTGTLKTFTLYIDPQTEDKMYRIDSCVLTSGAVNMPRGGIMTAEFEGEGTKLNRINTATLTDSSYTETKDLSFAVAKRVDVTVNSAALESILAVTLEVQNQVKWTRSRTLQDSLSVTDAANSMYSSNFILEKRVVAGNITQYINEGVTQSNTNIQTWKENIPIHIKAGLASNNYQLNAQLTPCSYTNRFKTSEAFTQSYDFRLLSTTAALTSLITT